MRLKDKVAIVTGGAHGIGRSIATALAAEGAKVAVADINGAAAIETANSLKKEKAEALAIATDVSIPESTEEMAKQIAKLFGKIDILVNSAAVLTEVKVSRASFYKIDSAEWDRVMAVNLKGTFLCTRAVFPYMKDQGGGKIINLASSSAFWGAPNFAHYVASKSGIIGLSRAIAREVGEFNINVNCIAPGSTLSEEPDNQEALDFREQAIPRRTIKRLEYPQDIAGTAVFLASPDSDFITGQTIVVDGGHVMH